MSEERIEITAPGSIKDSVPPSTEGDGAAAEPTPPANTPDNITDNPPPSSDNDFEGVEILTPDQLAAQNAEPTDTGSATPADTSSNVTDEGKQKILKGITDLLAENGLIAEVPEDYKGDLDELKGLLETTFDTKLNEGIEEYKSNFSGEKKKFLEIEDAFSSDQEQIAIQVAQDLSFYESVTPDQIAQNEDIQVALYTQRLRAQGFSQAEMTAMVEDAKVLNNLADKANEALPQLKAGAEQYVTAHREQKLASEQASKEQNEAEFNSMLQNIDERESFVEGLPFDKRHKDKLKASLSTTVHTDESGKEYNAVGLKQKELGKDFEVLLHYYDSLGLFDVDKKSGKLKPNLSKLKTTVKTQAANEIDSVIADEAVKHTNLNPGSLPGEDDNHSPGILNLLRRERKS